jgi:tetratricopeptide (TPR) repeat protein
VRSLLLVLAGLLVAAAPADAQAPVLTARGDSALARGDTAAARAAYASAVRSDSAASRALYQLGMLQPPGSAAAIALFERYTRLEPDDAWGYLAVGRAHEDAGALDAARAAYAAALRLEPADPEIAAAARRVAGTPAPRWTVEPVSGATGDSDGNRSLRLGAVAQLTAADSLQIGLAAVRSSVRDGWSGAAAWDLRAAVTYRPLRRLAFEAAAGAMRVQPDASFDGMAFAAARVEPVAAARMRWRPEHGPTLDLRLRHEPLAATPLLLASAVLVSEARATADLPVAGPLRIRGHGRLGSLREPDARTNRRTTWGAGAVLRAQSGAELSALYARTSYTEPSQAGYFAPARIDALDTGVYWEHYDWYPLTLALDAGGGIERITPHDGPAGAWQPALRLWSLASWRATDRAELRLELEAYRTQVAEVATSPGTWQWGSVSLGVVWRR